MPFAPRADRKPQLIICDDHRLVAEGLRELLQPEYDVTQIVCSTGHLMALLSATCPDCLLLDLEMPGKSGLTAIPCIRRIRAELAILVVTMLIGRGIADAAIGAGANGFVPKEAGCQELKYAIRSVLSGTTYVSPLVPSATHRVGLSAAHRALHRLTPRQQEIVLLLGDGKAGTDIAAELSVGPSTVTFHKHNIMRVLGLSTEADLLKYAVLVRASASDPALP